MQHPCLALLLPVEKLFQGVVVNAVAFLQLFHEGGIVLVAKFNGLGVHGLFDIALVAGQDYGHTVKAQPLRSLERNGIRYAAVQIQLAVNVYRLGDEGHGGGGTDGVHLRHGVFQTDVFRLAGFQIGYHHPEGDAGSVKGVRRQRDPALWEPCRRHMPY